MKSVLSFQSFKINRTKFSWIFFFVVVVYVAFDTHASDTANYYLFFGILTLVVYVASNESLFFTNRLLYTELLNEHFYYLKPKNKMSTIEWDNFFFVCVIKYMRWYCLHRNRRQACSSMTDVHFNFVFICLFSKGNGSERWVAKWKDKFRLFFFLFWKIKHHFSGGSHVICLRLILSTKLRNV